jgi:hypothetical protein
MPDEVISFNIRMTLQGVNTERTPVLQQSIGRIEILETSESGNIFGPGKNHQGGKN